MSTALATIETITAIDFYKPGASKPILEKLRAEVLEQAKGLDISTKTGRDAIASLAFKVAKSKTGLDKAGKELVAGEKERLKVIDKERAAVWDELEALQKDVRKPLTEWEDAEKARVAKHEGDIAELLECGTQTSQNWQTMPLVSMQERLAEIEAYSPDWQEFKARAEQVKAATIARLKECIAAREKMEAERIELARLREEQAKREQQEREDRIAREAKEAAEAAARQREIEAQAVAERERHEAEARIKQAEALRVAAEEKAIRDAAESERRRIAEQEASEARRVAAVEAERKRHEDEAKRLAAEAEAREKNSAHVKKINCAVRDALMANCTLLSSDVFTDKVAEELVAAIAKGLIPNIKIAY